MIWKAAERLGADDVFVAGLGKLKHFRREQPALAHLASVADNALDQRLCVRIFVRRNKAVFFCRVDHQTLKLGHIIEQHFAKIIFELAAAEHFVVLDSVVDLKGGKAHKPRNANLAVLLGKKVLKPVVCHFGIFYVDLADDTDLDLWGLVELYF